MCELRLRWLRAHGLTAATRVKLNTATCEINCGDGRWVPLGDTNRFNNI